MQCAMGFFPIGELKQMSCGKCGTKGGEKKKDDDKKKKA